MTMFDERERASESLFAHEEEVRFLALAGRNQLFARWAAEQLGLYGSERHGYIASFVEDAVQPQSDAALIDRVRADFLAEGVESTDERISAAWVTAMAEAVRQVRTETRAGAA